MCGYPQLLWLSTKKEKTQKTLTMGNDERILEAEYMKQQEAKKKRRLGAIGAAKIIRETEEKDKANRAENGRTDKAKNAE